MSAPIRVHFFTLTDSGGSEHIYLSELVDALTERGVQAVDDWRDADVVHLFEVNFLTAETLRQFQFPKLLRIIASDTPLVISTDDLYFSDDPSLTVHPRLYSLNNRLQSWLFNRADAIIAISESVRRRVELYIDSTPISVVHHGVDDAYRSPYTESEDPFVLHVSLAAPRKNPDAVLAVADRLSARMVIAGSGWSDRVPESAQNVETPGFVPESELVELYHDADVFYFPTRHEGFGLPILEAMASGTAVVTSDVYSVPEVTGDTAILCGPNDVEAHVETIQRLLDNETERRTLATNAYERAKGFTWEQSAEETEAVYRSVVR